MTSEPRANPEPVENVATAKRGVDAYNRLDLDTLAEITTPDFEWFPAMACLRPAC